MEHKSYSSVDTVLLARRMSKILDRRFVSARIVDRGAYASVYQLIEHSSASSPSTTAASDTISGARRSAVIVRISSRPVYNDVAIDEERKKIRVYVGTLTLIHESAPKQVRRRVPQILAYDASESTEFGLGWVAMTRVAGCPVAECWSDFGMKQKQRTIEDLGTLTRKLSRFMVADEIGSMLANAAASGSKSGVSRVQLSLPRRTGANNMRPYQSPRMGSGGHDSASSFMRWAVESEVAFLRQHQRPAARCFNMNMVRLRQCGMEDEIPTDVSFASTTSAVYRKQLRALGDLAQTILDAEDKEDDRFVLAHLHLSPENILVDEETGAVTGIVDWEFSGFVPEWLALAPPTWITNESLPTWSEGGWKTEEDESPYGSTDELEQLRTTWVSAVSWDDQSQTQHDASDKRTMWKACLSEWHELERACAWARGVVTVRHRSDDYPRNDGRNAIDLSYSDGEIQRPAIGRCPSPSTAESSTGPLTPIEMAVQLPPWVASNQKKDAPFVPPSWQYERSEESDDGDDEESDEESVVENDIDFEEFALSFEPPPLPHMGAPIVQLTAPSPCSELSFDIPSPKVEPPQNPSSLCFVQPTPTLPTFPRLFSSSSAGDSSSMVVVDSADSFEDIHSKVQVEKLPAVFYYTAVWCGPCRAMAPVIEKMSRQYPKIPVYKVDIDIEGLGNRLSNLKICSIPTFHFYHKGEKSSEVVGADVKKLEAAMESLHKQQ